MCSHFSSDNDNEIPLTEQNDSLGELAELEVVKERQAKIAFGVVIVLVALTALLALAF